jgi:hypothetical protein
MWMVIGHEANMGASNDILAATALAMSHVFLISCVGFSLSL